MTDRFIIDDTGTLIDTETRNTYDYVSDIVDLLNNLHKDNEYLKKCVTATDELLIQQWKENTRIKKTIKEAHYNERTALGKSVLKQLLDQME